MGIKSNASVEKNPIFKNLIDGLNPKASFNAGKEMQMGRYTSKVKSLEDANIKLGEDLVKYNKSADNAEKMADTIDKIEKNKNKITALNKEQDILSKGLKGTNLNTKIGTVASTMKDYYNPFSKNSPGKIGMAARYGATAGVAGLATYGVLNSNENNRR